MRAHKGLVAGLLSLAMAMTACGGGEAEDPATADPDAASADPAATEPVGDADLTGTEVTLLIHPTLYEAAGGDGGLVAEFQEMTGAEVTVVTAGVTEYIERAMVEFSTGSGRFDVIAMENSHLNDEVVPHLLDLSPYVAETGDEWDYEDFPASLRDPVTKDDGKLIGIPYRFAANALYYRQDLFDEAGVEAPTSLDEVVEVSEAVLETTGTTPWIQRGAAEEIVHDWLNFFYGYGGDILSEDRSSCQVNSEAGVQAADLYRELFEGGLVPDDLFAITRDDYIARMQRGEVAAGVYYAPYWGRLVDEESQVADDMAFALQPTGPDVEPGRTRAAGWYLSVAQDSKNADAAWQLVEFITSPENLLRGALEWSNAPVRLSTYEAPEFVEQFPVAEVWADALAASVQDPAVEGMPQIVDILSEELVAIVRGDTPSQEGLDAACDRIDAVVGS